MDRDPEVWEGVSPEEEEHYREIIRERVNNSPYYQLVGLEVTGLGPGWATFRMPVDSRLFNVGGVVHGGAITSIADAAAGVALATLLERFKERPVTVEQKVNFCAPVAEGVLEARGRVAHKGGRIAVCDVEVNEGGRLVAKALSTYMILRVGE